MPSVEAYRHVADQIDQVHLALTELLADSSTAGIELPGVFADANHQAILLPGQLRRFADTKEAELRPPPAPPAPRTP